MSNYIPKHRKEVPDSFRYRVEFMSSERGWGVERWSEDYDSHEEARRIFNETNAKNTAPVAPAFYIKALSIDRIVS